MTERREPIRSYQRIFRPERRIYHLEGRPLPVPGGVPLRWLAYAAAALIAALIIGSGSPMVVVLAGTAGGGAGLAFGGRGAVLPAAVAGLAAAWVAGLALGLLDWPLRLVVLPAAIATLATQATPDGRGAGRFAVSWLALRLAPSRRSLGRALPSRGSRRLLGAALWVAADDQGPKLRRGRVRGAGTIGFAAEMLVRREGRGGRVLARPAGRRVRRGERRASRIAIGAGEVLEIRP